MTADALQLTHVTKAFAGKTVLRDVALTVGAGEVHGLVGANGAGKSTLIKTLAGVHAPERGASCLVGGVAVALPADPRTLMARGVRFVHQDLGLVETMTIAENFTVEPGLTPGMLAPWSGRAERARCAERLARFGLPYAPGTVVADLSMSERVMIAVVRAVTDAAGATTLLVLDEATSGLPRDETAAVLELVRRTAEQGVGVLFVSHRLDEVVGVCDRVTALRDGVVVATLDSTSVAATGRPSVEALSHAMFGGVAAAAAPRAARAAAAPRGDVRLRVDGLRGRVVRDIAFTVAAGEILGLTGLITSGAAEVGRLLFGAERPAGGQVVLDGAPYAPRSPRDAKGRGVAYVPASRDLSLLKGLTALENATLADLTAFRPARLRRRAERQAATALLERFTVVPADPDVVVGALSGGNQQKIALLKWLRCDPAVLILDEPCRGVDVAARHAIYDLLREAASDGLAVLVITSEVEDATELCDRALVMEDGAIVAELTGSDLDADTLTRALNPTEPTHV